MSATWSSDAKGPLAATKLASLQGLQEWVVPVSTSRCIYTVWLDYKGSQPHLHGALAKRSAADFVDLWIRAKDHKEQTS